jgi:hypothetical protein
MQDIEKSIINRIRGGTFAVWTALHRLAKINMKILLYTYKPDFLFRINFLAIEISKGIYTDIASDKEYSYEDFVYDYKLNFNHTMIKKQRIVPIKDLILFSYWPIKTPTYFKLLEVKE